MAAGKAGNSECDGGQPPNFCRSNSGIGKDAGENLTPGLRLPPVQETRPFSSGVELHLKAGRTPFDGNSVYLKTGQRFRVALKYRTDCA